MKIRRIIGWAMFAATLACSGAWAWDQDPAAQYFERKDTIVSGAGDAKDVNAATHIIDPWPRYVGNRRIPANGERMTGAVERYRTNRPWATPCPITPTYDIQTSLRILAPSVTGCTNYDRPAPGAAPAAAPGVAIGLPLGLGGY